MATVRERVSKRGEVTFYVTFRAGGKQTSRTYEDRASAQRLADLLGLMAPVEALRAMGEGVDPTTPQVTVDDLYVEWHRWKARSVTPRTAKDYAAAYLNWIGPSFGQYAAASITELDVQEWVDDVLGESLDPKTIAGHHAVLHSILKWASARKRALIPHNPCLETDLPRRTKKAPRGITLPEWAALRDASRRLHPDSADLMLFIASTGWRMGEATALTARDVEDDGERMYASMTQVQRKGEGIIVGGKSMAAGRRIRMLPECAEMLRERTRGMRPGDLVFTNPQGVKEAWEPGVFRKGRWLNAVREAGLEPRNPTPHWLRHTHVALCLAVGMSLPEIQRRLGHEDIQTTINVYGRMIDEMTDDVADRMDALLGATAAPRTVAGEVVTPGLPALG